MDDSCSTFMSKRHNPYESRNAMNPGTTFVSRARLAPQVLLWVDSLRGFPAENNSSNGGGNLKKSSKQNLGTLIKNEQTVRKVTSDLDHSLCTEEEEEGEEEEEEQETSSSEEEEELSHEYSSSADRRRGARSRSAQEEIQQARKLLKILNLEHMISEEDVFESSFQSKSRRQRSNYLNSVACKKTRRSAAAYHHAMSKKFDLDRDISCASDIDEMEEEDEESGRRAAELKEDDVNSAMQLWSAPSQSNKDSTSDQQSEPKKNQISKDVQQTISQWRYKPLAGLPNRTSQQQQQHNNNNNHQLLDIIKSDTTTCQALNQQDKELLIQQDQDHYKDSSACCTPMLSYSKLLSSKNLMMVNKMKSSESAHHHTLLQVEIQKLRDSMEQQARQIGILTKSNSNLLLRIETLEKEIKLLTSIHFVSSTLSSS